MTKIFRWNLAGLFFTLTIGTLLHFVYDWFGGSFWAVIGAVNESTWEHLKLVFWPIAIFAVVEYWGYGSDIPGFLAIKTISLWIAMGTIVTLFYTYTGILGKHLLFCDILIFILGTMFAYWFAWRHLQSPRSQYALPLFRWLSVVLLIVFLFCFVLFTFWPPRLPLFLPPS